MNELEHYIDTAGGEGLEDYRQYFTFDLEMEADTENGATQAAAGKMSLSARAFVQSGGEGQTPFYVAMAAAMAMAYYPEGHRPDVSGGMGLVMFDEAFDKLDHENTEAVVRFYKDLGLQLLVAAPEAKRPIFTEALDTVTSISRSGSSVYVASDFPKDRARAEMARINPHHIGIEGFRRLIEQQSDAA